MIDILKITYNEEKIISIIFLSLAGDGGCSLKASASKTNNGISIF